MQRVSYSTSVSLLSVFYKLGCTKAVTCTSVNTKTQRRLGEKSRVQGKP
uniref:Uncharacterized protein n=1 Tax=Myoviridae sp. ctshb19 TaxID=2825194 RepID=A0A8S5UG67_9CAUD|nr:MAG TPA: hypothetical protein [Myoviridae sp. ctshb19]